MSVWDKIEQLAQELQFKFQSTSLTSTSHEDPNGWKNYLYYSPTYRRAHVEVVDFRQQYNIYILHSTVFPHFNDPSPIWGFDAVCGPNKITGAFHDFSSGGKKDHYMMKWFSEESNLCNWKKPRELPTWAKEIFSSSMIAAGNIREDQELDDLYNFALNSLDYYLDNVGETFTLFSSYREDQNRYCYYQKQNPHIIKTMVTMGVPEEEMHRFVNEVLFPECVNKNP